MACFLVPVAEAVITTVATKIIQKKEANSKCYNNVGKFEFSKKLKWLSNLLWGGSALLAFEHVWHGEIISSFPFLTAAASPETMVEMLNEMASVGVGMALAITVVWLGMLVVSNIIENKEAQKAME